MKVTVCEIPDDRKVFEIVWEEFIVYVRKQQSDLVLLPALPFSSWFARTPQFDAQVWQRAQQEHDVMMNFLLALAPAIVVGTHLVSEEERHLNRGFCWTQAEGYKGIHDKYYFPNEEDFYERCWFDRNQRDFTLASIQDLAIGFLICTEVILPQFERVTEAEIYSIKLGKGIMTLPRFDRVPKAEIY